MRRTAVAVLSTLCLTGMAGTAQATPTSSAAAVFRDPSRELLVLLDRGRGVPKPEEVIDKVRNKQPLPPSLGLGSPDEAHWLIPEPDRSKDPGLDPDSPAGLLNRYIVLSYPLPIDVPALRQSMGRNRNILYASENRPLHVSVLPNDPKFPPPPGIPNPTPDQYQWGSSSLHLPEAWDYNKGHSYIGVVDHGLAVQHPDLRTFHKNASGQWVFDHGNYRPQFAFDYGFPSEGPNCPGDPNSSPNCVDEGQPELVGGMVTPVVAGGHGTHVSGIIGATANSGVDVAGACWNCSLIVSKFSVLVCNASGCRPTDPPPSVVVSGIYGALQKGAQVLNLSAGYRPENNPPDCQANPFDAFCLALQQAQDRDVIFVAAAGNDQSSQPDFPANDARVIGAAGIDITGSLWNDCATTSFQCGSNYGPEMIAAPAKQILSTFYPGLPYNTNPGSTCLGNSEVGACTGTSMASPYLAGSIGILRSVNPLLSKDNVRTLLISNLENPPGWNPAFGKGKPNLGAAVRAAQGTARGAVIANRLTPLFSFYGPVEDFFYTTVPQMAAAAILNSSYDSVGLAVNGYPDFPGLQCQAGPCIDPAPRASAYIFTGDRTPYTSGTPVSPPLLPLYRLSYKGTNPNGNTSHRDTTYTTEDNGVLAFKQVGYELDGIEGYVYQRCAPTSEPGCIPPGAVRLYRRYNPQRDDFAIFPESELPSMVSQGYTSTGGFNEILGYVYPNADSDGDNVIDGFETLLGSNPQRRDSDCDGIQDGTEVLGFPAGDPLGAPGCIPPVARFSVSCNSLVCSFNATTSTDNVGITSYAWSFGDSTNGTGVTAAHTFAASGSYNVTLTVTDTDGLTSTLTRQVNINNAPPTAAEGFFTVPLCRVVDTRNTAALMSGQARTIQVTGTCGIPAGAKAVSVTITIVSPSGEGFLLLLPGNSPSSPYSISPPSINFATATSPRANNAVLQLDSAGKLSAFPYIPAAPGQAHLILDVAGYFSESASPAPGAQGPFGFQTITPCRIADTRASTPVTTGAPRSFTVQGVCGIPPGAAAAALTLTVLQPTAVGHVILYPSDNSTPLVSTINFNSGSPAIANGARLRLAASTPDITAVYGAQTAGATVHLILDAQGYFKMGEPLKYHPVIPCRELDTRFADQGAPVLAAGESRIVQIRGNCGIPPSAKAAVVNLVSVAPAGPGFLSAYAAGTPFPGTSTLNFDPSLGALANGAIVPLGTNGSDLTITSGVSGTHLIVDVFGYFD